MQAVPFLIALARRTKNKAHLEFQVLMFCFESSGEGFSSCSLLHIERPFSLARHRRDGVAMRGVRVKVVYEDKEADVDIQAKCVLRAFGSRRWLASECFLFSFAH
jgi:hypothetical protein